jgi:hypothetical protein
MTNFNAVYVSVPNLRPAQILYSQAARDWYAQLVDVADPQSVYRVRAASPSLLKKAILKQWPSATFSEVPPKPKEDEIKAELQRLRDDRPVGKIVINDRQVDEVEHAYTVLTRAYGQIINGMKQLAPGTEITLDMCRRQGIRERVYEALKAREEQNRVSEVMREHEQNVAQLNPEEAKQFREGNVQLLITQGPNGWKEWFASCPNFLHWPNNSGQNYAVLLEWCKQRGYIVPTVPQLQEGMKYLLDCGHFHRQSEYKRSEQYKRDAVRPFTRIESVSESVSDAEINRAVTALTAKFGLPLRVTLESLQSVGTPNAEKVFAALREKFSTPDLKGMNSEELKAYGRDMRNQARGRQPISRYDAGRAKQGY